MPVRMKLIRFSWEEPNKRGKGFGLKERIGTIGGFRSLDTFAVNRIRSPPVDPEFQRCIVRIGKGREKLKGFEEGSVCLGI